MKLTPTALALLSVFTPACVSPQERAPQARTDAVSEPEQSVGVHLPRGPAEPVARQAAQLTPWMREASRPTPSHRPAGKTTRSAALELDAQLRAQKVSGLHFHDEGSLRKVMSLMQAMTGINVHVEQAAEDAMLDGGHTIDVDIDRSMTVATALNLLTELAGDDVAWVSRHGVVLVTTIERAAGEPTTFVYDISDLLSRPRSFIARDINVSPSGGIFASDEDPIEPGPIVDENLLLELIMNTIDPDSWDRGRNSVTIRGGKLIVTHD
ncbi:MAG: hypothetical protein V3T22_00660 [Planctomycetota bacterium]